VACGSEPRRPAPPEFHTVRAGDTLYSIAVRHGLDYRELARWNGIGRDYRIYVGQRIRLRPPWVG
jgi:lipoprotein NlpD